jgi:hypothetical protein
MSRKKMKRVVRSKVKKAASKAKNSGLALIATMQKEFKATPTKIAALYRKESAALKLQEKKMLAELKKIQAKAKKVNVKQSKLTSKSTATAKKQLAVLKKNQDKLNKVVSELTVKLAQVKNLINMMNDKQTAYAALGKELAKIEKQIATTKPAKPAQKKTAKKMKAAKLPAMHDTAARENEMPATFTTMNDSAEISSN